MGDAADRLFFRVDVRHVPRVLRADDGKARIDLFDFEFTERGDVFELLF